MRKVTRVGTNLVTPGSRRLVLSGVLVNVGAGMRVVRVVTLFVNLSSPAPSPTCVLI